MLGMLQAIRNRDAVGLFYASLSWLLSLLVLSLVPATFLIVYLFYYGAFSYDIFMPNVFGLGLFAALAGLWIATLAYLQCGALMRMLEGYFQGSASRLKSVSEIDDSASKVLGSGKRRASEPITTQLAGDHNKRTGAEVTEKVGRGFNVLEAILLGIVNILTNIFLLLDGGLGAWLIALFLSLSVIAYFSAMIAANQKAAVMSLASAALAIFLMTVFVPRVVAHATGAGLNVLGLGGLKAVSVKMNQLNEHLEHRGALVLLAPSTVTLLVGDEDPRIVILDRSNTSEINIEPGLRWYKDRETERKERALSRESSEDARPAAARAAGSKESRSTPALSFSIALELMTVLLLAAGLVIYLMQRNATLAASRADNFFALVSFLQRDEVREARKFVMNELPSSPISSWPEEADRKAQLVASTYDIAAVAIHHRLLQSEAFSIPWSPSIVACYKQLEEFIRVRQDERGRLCFAHFVGLAIHLEPHLASEGGPYGVTFEGPVGASGRKD